MPDRRLFCSVVGARPQFVKAAPLERALRAAGMAHVTIHTGQHFDPGMSDVFFEDLSLQPPVANLGIHSLPRQEMIDRMSEGLGAALRARRPDMIVVYGDTNSTLAGALAGAAAGIPVAHVEAGLRSFNPAMPEEINRIAVDRLSDLLFCPTSAARANLAREGRVDGVFQCGDVMYDQVLHVVRAGAWSGEAAARLGLAPGGYAVATLHRAETTEDPATLQRMMDWIAAQAGALPVVFPVHPRTRQVIVAGGLRTTGLTLIEPLGFVEMAGLVHHASVVFTDSGGLQKEAYFHRVPCVTLRNETEWVETIEAGWNRLWTEAHYRPRRDIAEYGDGQASGAIVAAMIAFLDRPRATGPDGA